MAEANRERTFLMIKPDAVSRGLIGEIVTRFEKKGFKLVAMKFVKVKSWKSYPKNHNLRVVYLLIIVTCDPFRKARNILENITSL